MALALRRDRVIVVPDRRLWIEVFPSPEIKLLSFDCRAQAGQNTVEHVHTSITSI